MWLLYLATEFHIKLPGKQGEKRKKKISGLNNTHELVRDKRKLEICSIGV